MCLIETFVSVVTMGSLVYDLRQLSFVGRSRTRLSSLDNDLKALVENLDETRPKLLKEGTSWPDEEDNSNNPDSPFSTKQQVYFQCNNDCTASCKFQILTTRSPY